MVQCSLVTPLGVIEHRSAMADAVLHAPAFMNAGAQGSAHIQKALILVTAQAIVDQAFAISLHFRSVHEIQARLVAE